MRQGRLRASRESELSGEKSPLFFLLSLFSALNHKSQKNLDVLSRFNSLNRDNPDLDVLRLSLGVDIYAGCGIMVS